MFSSPPRNSGDESSGADLDKTCTRIPGGEANENAVVAEATVNSAAVPGKSCIPLGLNRVSEQSRLATTSIKCRWTRH